MFSLNSVDLRCDKVWKSINRNNCAVEIPNYTETAEKKDVGSKLTTIKLSDHNENNDMSALYLPYQIYFSLRYAAITISRIMNHLF